MIIWDLVIDKLGLAASKSENCVFLEKKRGLRGWRAYFSRKRLVCIAGWRISLERKWVAWPVGVFSVKSAGVHDRLLYLGSS